jgi:hypothetical protein
MEPLAVSSLRISQGIVDQAGLLPFARALCKAARAMARAGVALAATSDAALEGHLTQESLNYALHLVDLRLRAADGQDHRSLLRALRQVCWRLIQSSGSPDPGPPRLGGCAACAESAPNEAVVEGGADSLRGQISPALFEEFRRATGLNSAQLVGEGENVASLVFTIVLHGLVARDWPFNREQTMLLLQAARQCRRHIACAVTAWQADSAKDLRLDFGVAAPSKKSQHLIGNS